MPLRDWVQDGFKLGSWDWRYTLAVVLIACIFQVTQVLESRALQVSILGRFYDYCPLSCLFCRVFSEATIVLDLLLHGRRRGDI